MKEEVAAQVHPVAEATEGVAHHRGGGEVAVAAVAVHAVQIDEVSNMGAGCFQVGTRKSCTNIEKAWLSYMPSSAHLATTES